MADVAGEEAGLEAPRMSDEDLMLEEEFDEEAVVEVEVEPPRAEPEEAMVESAKEPSAGECDGAAPVVVEEAAPALEESPAVETAIRINFSMDDDAELEDELAEVEECDHAAMDETARFAPGWLMKKPFSSLAPMWFRYQSLSEYQRKVVLYSIGIGILVLLGVVALLALFVVVPRNGDNGVATQGMDKFAFVEASNGVVAGDCERCAIAGVAIMEQKGGNAIDAAVAACLCVGVVQPFSSGIGGGAVILVRLANGTEVAIDSREVAPAAAFEDMFAEDAELATFGALSAGVPGELRGLSAAWELYGSGNVAWKDLFEEAIVAAEEMEVTELMVENLLDAGYDRIADSPGLAETYITEEGEFVKVGDVIKRPQLAATLRLIANKGVEEFYTGSVARDLVSDIREAGGIISLDDLQNYTIERRLPVATTYRGLKLIGAPPPFGGAVALMAFNILEGFQLKADDSQSLHYIAESWKFAFDDRRVLGDPSFMPDNFTDVVKTMLSKEHAADLRHRILDDSVLPLSDYSDLSPVGESVDDHGTMHLNVVDSLGNAVALTSTVNLLWGGKFVSPRTGIVMNNQMDDFSSPGFDNHFLVPPHESNYIVPGKRPLSSMNPLIVTKGEHLAFAVGASGGTKIITGPMQVLLNCLFFNRDVGEAVGLPRIHDQLLPLELKAEADFDSELLVELEERGHNVTRLDQGSWLANVAAIQVITNQVENSHQLYGAGDYRKHAAAAGY